MTTRRRGRGSVLAATLVASLAALLGAWVPGAHADVAAQGCSSHAVVVVEPGPGPVPICFDGTISGMDALQLAGANPVTYGFSGQGAAVCQLYGVGNPPDSSCLIGGGGQYWAYYRAGPGAGGWTYSRAGASTTTVTDGSMEGWRYGTGAAPTFVDYCSVVGCAPPATDPPATQPAPPPDPPASAAPQASGAASGPATPTVAGESASRPDGKAADAKGDGKAADGSTTASGDPKPGTPSTTGRDGRTTSATRRTAKRDSVEVAAGAGGGGSGGGSPIGMVVALAVVAAAVAGGLLLRRRRRGPAPG